MQIDDLALETCDGHRGMERCAALIRAGRLGEARRAVDLVALREGGPRAAELRCLVAHAMGEHGHAAVLAEECLAASTSTDDHGRARARRLLAERLWDVDLRHHWDRVRELLLTGRELCGQATHEFVAQTILLGEFSLCRREFSRGRRYLAEARQRIGAVRPVSLRIGLGVPLRLALARDAQGRRQLVRARRLLLEAEAAALEVQDSLCALRVAGQLARTALMTGRPRPAADALEECLQAMSTQPRTGLGCWPDLEVELQFFLAECRIALSDAAGANRSLRRASSLASSMGAAEVVAELQVLQVVSDVLGADRRSLSIDLQAARSTCSREHYDDLLLDLHTLCRSRRYLALVAGDAEVQSTTSPPAS